MSNMDGLICRFVNLFNRLPIPQAAAGPALAIGGIVLGRLAFINSKNNNYSDDFVSTAFWGVFSSFLIELARLTNKISSQHAFGLQFSFALGMQLDYAFFYAQRSFEDLTDL